MFSTALFIIAKKRENSKCPLTTEWINRGWCIHIVEYYSAIKRNAVLIPAAT